MFSIIHKLTIDFRIFFPCTCFEVAKWVQFWFFSYFARLSDSRWLRAKIVVFYCEAVYDLGKWRTVFLCSFFILRCRTANNPKQCTQNFSIFKRVSLKKIFIKTGIWCSSPKEIKFWKKKICWFFEIKIRSGKFFRFFFKKKQIGDFFVVEGSVKFSDVGESNISNSLMFRNRIC